MEISTGFSPDGVVWEGNREYDLKKQPWKLQEGLSEDASHWTDRWVEGKVFWTPLISPERSKS
jgi:hypothetical protein